jgi:hypothetical protein
MTPFRLPGQRIFEGIRNLIVRVGVLTGAYLCAVMVISVLAATQLHFLEPFAEIRNWSARGAFALIMVVPVLTFLRRPAHLLGASLLGWMIFALGYKVMGIFFVHLHSRLNMTPFHAFILGAIFYLVASASAWVLSMILDARQQPVTVTRRKL